MTLNSSQINVKKQFLYNSSVNIQNALRKDWDVITIVQGIPR